IGNLPVASLTPVVPTYYNVRPPCWPGAVRFTRQFCAFIGGFMKLSPGKLAGLKAVSNERGVIAAAAMDQRGSLQKSLAKEKGADCVKILLYYTPFDPKPINDIKHAWVERLGDECRANDIPFFLEFVGYEEGADEKGFEYAKKKPEIVTESMREFSKERYGVDVLKVEVPIK